MKERVTKEIAIALKGIGYDVPTNKFYNLKITHRIIEAISAPTVYEAIEWLDSKGVYVVPYVNTLIDGWLIEIIDGRNRIDMDEMFKTYPTRLAAYTAGLSVAIDYLKNKKG
jgi:hypothetical protein